MQATTIKNQTLYDIAVQTYGDVDAAFTILQNQSLAGDAEDSMLAGEVDLGARLAAGSIINYDSNDRAVNKRVTQNIAGNTATGGKVVSCVPRLNRLHVRTGIFLNALPDTLSWEDTQALDRLVRDLHGESNIDYKTANVWNKLIAMYPFVGTTDVMHSFNLVNPTGDGVVFTATTHSASGAAFDGSISFATLPIALADLHAEDISAGVCNSDWAGSWAGGERGLIGAVDGGEAVLLSTQANALWGRVATATAKDNAFTGFYNAYYMINAGADTVKVYQDATELATQTAAPAAFSSGTQLLIGDIGGMMGGPFKMLVCTAHVGRALTDAEQAALVAAIRGFNLALNRL